MTASETRNLAGDVPPSLRDADEVLTRYGRWAMDRLKVHRCGSAEGQYRAPPNDEDRKPKEQILPTPQALAVHRALIRVPDRERVVLHVLYVPKRASPAVQLRLLQIPPRTSQSRHIDGLRMFDNLWRVAMMRAT